MFDIKVIDNFLLFDSSGAVGDEVVDSDNLGVEKSSKQYGGDCRDTESNHRVAYEFNDLLLREDHDERVD